MPVDPNIALAGNNNGLNWNGPISLADLALKTQQIKMQQQKLAGQNALAAIFSNPSNLDATGTLTPRALQQVTAIDPARGMQIRQQSIEDQLKRAQAEHFKTEAGTAKWTALSGLAGIASDAYDDAKSKGASEQDARAAAVAARNAAVDANGGTLSEDDQRGVRSSLFDPVASKAFAGSNKEWSARKSKTAEDVLKDRTEAERERHDTASEGNIAAAIAGRQDKDPTAAKWQVLSDKDGTQYRYNPETAVATTLDGKPYAPKGAAKIGNATAAGAAFTPEEGGLMAALAQEGVSVPAGFRSKEQQKALYSSLLERNPGKTPDEIADGIKKGQIEFGAQKKETQTAAGQAGKVEVAQNEISEFIPLVKEASAKVNRGSFVPLNKLMQTADTSISDPNLKALKIRINSLLNSYDQLAARGGTDATKREEVRSLLTSADSPEALDAALDSFSKEAEAAHNAAVKATRVPELPDEKGKAGTPKGDPSKLSDDELKKALGL